MGDEIAWLEEWCSANIKKAKADDLVLAQELATRATTAAAAKGIFVNPIVVALGYPSLEDFMLDQLASRSDAAMKNKRRARRHNDYGRRAHQPDPNAKYGFNNDPRREPSVRSRTAQ